MRWIGWIVLFAIAVVGMSAPASAAPFTFLFNGTFVESNLPDGTSNWELRVTVDNGGQSPVGTFHPTDWVRYELRTGDYVQTWDPTAGGTLWCGEWSCFEIDSDGVNATLAICSWQAILPDPASLCGATDNHNPGTEWCLSTLCGPGVMPCLWTDSASGHHATLAIGVTTLPGVVAGAPDCSLARASLATLWPPNHQFSIVHITDVIDPDGDPVTIEISGVTSDEHAAGSERGDSCPDAVLQGDRVLLRAERAGRGDGRVYTVQFTATDPSGNECSSSVDVCVPHDRSTSSCVKDAANTIDATVCGPERSQPFETSNARLWVSQRSESDLGISFSVTTAGPVKLAIYDLRGRRVWQDRRTLTAGDHMIQWNGVDFNGRELATGVYLVRLMAGETIRTVKTVWVRN